MDKYLSHKRLHENAEKAINELFANYTVTLETTLGSMEELQAIIQDKIDGLEEDIRNKE